MATVQGAHSSHGGGVHMVSWAALANADSGSPAVISSHPDRTVQVTGTFGAGGTVVMQGSNDGTNWAQLTDPQGNAVSFTAAGIETLMENPLFIRPLVTAGDGTTALTVSVTGVANY